MADIFGRASQAFGGAMAADSVKLTFSGGPTGAFTGPGTEASSGTGLFEKGMLGQQLQMQYQQQVTRIYEIGTNLTYFVVGRTSGQVSLGRIIGPTAIAGAFYARYGDACNAAKNTLTFTAGAGCNSGATTRAVGSTAEYTVLHVLINSIGISVNASDMMINEQVAMMFNSLEVK